MYPNYIKPIHAKLPDFINLNPIITINIQRNKNKMLFENHYK